MKRVDQAPVAWESLPEQVDARVGFRYRTLAAGPGAGDLRAHRSVTSLLQWSDGMGRPWGRADELEMHPLHEEIFVLTGTLLFDDWYRLDAPVYLNHPPFWAHPTNFRAEGELTMLVRDHFDPVVQLTPIPTDYRGQDFFVPGRPTRARAGVQRLELDELPLSRIHDASGRDTGIAVRRVWEDLDDDWVTWLMDVPAGWSLPGPGVSLPGGDELFIVVGDLSFDYRGVPSRLTRYGFAADCTSFPLGRNWRSEGGCRFVRWTRGADWTLATT